MIKPTVLTAPVKSKSDKKNYRLIRLENGLHALLIHHDSWDEATKDENKSKFVSESDQSAISDETCEEGEEEEEEDDRQKLAAVALNIGVGSFQDPEDIQGLAHFVEHMIFMGSEKYPKENELDQYLSANGGASNAHTECEYTLFHLDIVEDFLAGAVDRFASLFVSPLMLRDSMSREIEAVESEFQNNINNDDCRLEQMWASKANGVAGTFTWGNSKTLKEEVDPDKLYDAAHEFRKKYYVANNMWLCIESAESLDSLQCLVEKHFTGIKSGNTEKQIRTAPATDHFKAEFYDKLFYVKPKGDKCKIYLTFVFPSLESHYKTKPHDFLAFIIQHDGVGSLSSYLKRNLLALSVSAGANDQAYEGNSLFTLFGIEILLTEKGYENMNKVLEAIFSTLLMLKSTPIDTLEETFNELKQIHDTSFDYSEEKQGSENAELFAVGMKYYEPQDIITGPDIYHNFDAEMITKLISVLNSGKFNLTLLTDKHDKYKFTEKWFGTEYDEMDFPGHIRDLWNARQLSAEFCIPPPNDFICSNFDIVNKPLTNQHASEPSVPERIAEESIELWFKPDEKFLLPHGFINCYMQSSKVFKSPSSIVLMSLYSMIVKHYLTEKLYPAVCAGLGYSISAAEKGMLIKLSGYNEKLPLVMDIIAKELKSIATQVEPAVFETYREQCKRNGFNNLISSKFFNRDCRLTIIEEQHQYSFEQYNAAATINFDQLVAFASAFPEELSVKMMVHGNFRKSEAVEIAKAFKENVKFTSVDVPRSRARKIPTDRPSVLYIKSPMPNDKNSTITNYYQIDKSTIKRQCLIEFVEKLCEEPLFDILRTKEQLGYAVGCSHRANNGILGFSLTLQIQEDKHTTVAVNERIEKFLRDDFLSVLNKLTDEEFETVQVSLIKLKKMDEVEMDTENNRLWSEITSNEYLFTRFDMEAEMLGRFTKQDVRDFYENVFLKAPKLSIQVIGNKGSEVDEDAGVPIMKVLENQTGSQDENVIADVIEFRNQLELFEAYQTVVDL